MRGAEERAPNRILACTQDGGHGLQLEALVMSQFEHQALFDGKFVQRPQDLLPELSIQRSSFRTGTRLLVGSAIKYGLLPPLIFALVPLRVGIAVVELLAAEIIAAQIRNDTIDLGIERTLEAEPINTAVSAEERFLINVLSVFGGISEMHG